MSEIRLEEQIRCLEEMEDCLEQFVIIMQDCIDEFYECIVKLRENGLTFEFGEHYESTYYYPAKTKVDEVIGNIQYGHIRYLNDVIDYLKGLRD